MNGNYYYKQTKKEIENTVDRIGFPLEEEEIILITNYNYWHKYSGANATNNINIRIGSRLDFALLNAKIDYDYPELAE